MYRKYKLRKLIRVLKGKRIDILFVIKGTGFDFADWKKMFSLIDIPLKVMYQWDSVRNFDYTNVASLFDKVYTFDYLRPLSLTFLQLKHHLCHSLIPLELTSFSVPHQWNFRKRQ